eukprot:5022364-Prymnesium_polylepis.1
MSRVGGLPPPPARAPRSHARSRWRPGGVPGRLRAQGGRRQGRVGAGAQGGPQERRVQGRPLLLRVAALALLRRGGAAGANGTR